ncbi:MAG: ABC transporter ATP-binding protein [Peptococcaceae bacterium]|nr:ABC transporter ATP-binding protein [Peptococcaceae bacterium]
MAHSHNKRHGGYRGHNKPKDLVGTWKKLLGYCRRYLAVFMIAILCAAAGTVLTLIGPDKLSEMTDTITAGITPNTEALTELTEAASENASANMQEVSTAIAANLQSSTPKAITVNGSEISLADQRQTLSLLSGLDDPDAATMQETMAKLPEAVTNALYSDVTIDGQTISAADQRAAMEIMSGIDPEESEDALEAMDKLPDSVYSLIAPSIDMDKVQRIGFILVTFYALSYLFSAIQGWITAGVTQRVSQQLRGDISRKINRLPIAFYNRTSTGDILSRVTNDVDLISQSLNQSIGNLITSVILLFGSLQMMLITNLWMTLTAILASLLGFVVMFAIMGRSQKYFARQQRHLGALNGHIEEMYTGHTVVKAYNGEAAAQQTFDQMNDKLRESGFRAQTLAGMMMPVMTFVGNLGYVAVCVVGGAMALNDRISFGVIVAFMMYVRYFTQPLSQIAQAVQSLQSAAAAGERVFEFLEAEEMPNESGKKSDIGAVQGTVDFDHVRFGYEDTDKIVIHDFSAHAKPGQKIAIVGPTGAGKTTMVNLLMRFHDIQSGEIRIDGVPTNEMTREAVREQFCMVLQDTWLFEGTLRENLIYCTENVSDEKMIAACKAVGLDHFIRTLPKGYDTVVGDQLSLSQGQKQQLTIARAMIADKPMLILDEATSSVDTRTEQQIQSAMDKLMENRTSFVIAHRLSTIRNADLILVMNHGDIVESGTHEELLAKGGFYAELYNSQFEQAG